jgi:hypothetical protein
MHWRRGCRRISGRLVSQGLREGYTPVVFLRVNKSLVINGLVSHGKQVCANYRWDGVCGSSKMEKTGFRRFVVPRSCLLGKYTRNQRIVKRPRRLS